MEWLLIIIPGFIAFIVAFDKIATKTPPDLVIFGWNIGKWDNELAKALNYIKDIILIFLPNKK